ncbi:uncharacterized protein G2W53_033373 [Senna tora]|uniref:Uncharacterized protein n=1 Tax=Senna tora TaxID=362788 RepID=A0A834T002_9FABA|nr:uncharacterized protein G2W53_033373 [Senna tora]
MVSIAAARRWGASDLPPALTTIAAMILQPLTIKLKLQ